MQKWYSSSVHLILGRGGGDDTAGYLTPKLNAEEISKSNSTVRGSLTHVFNSNTGLNGCTLIVIHTWPSKVCNDIANPL